MPNLHQDKSNNPVKASAKIKLERDLGPEILAAFADQKPSKLCWIRMERATIHLIKHFWGNYEKRTNTTKNNYCYAEDAVISEAKKIMWTY